MGGGRFVRAARFVGVVWTVALAFQALAQGVPRLVNRAFNAGVIAPHWAISSVAPSCPDGLVASPATPVDPALVRALTFRLGTAVGFAAAARTISGEAAIAGSLANLHRERAPVAAVLGVPTPELPPVLHVADALSEYETFLQADPDCISARLGRTYGDATGALYQLGATAGFVTFYRSSAPELGPLFVPQLSAYGERAGIPPALWAPLASDLSSVSSQEARQHLVGAMETMRRSLLEAGAR